MITGAARAVKRGEDNAVVDVDQPLTAIPYYAWAHRGVGDMAVWMARTADKAVPAPPATLMTRSTPTASYLNPSDSLAALSDGTDPKASGDQSIARFTWWDHKGTSEWVQYDFPGETAVSGCGVYWFDDGPDGGCRVPERWQVLYKDGDHWRKADTDGTGGVNKDRWNDVSFKPVKTTALRLEVRLRKEFSGGILEWRVKENRAPLFGTLTE